jgi:hypothetical protein
MGGYEQTMDQMVSSLNLPEEELQTLMEVLKYLLQNEQQYPQLRQRLIQEAGLDPEDIPEEFDRGYLTTMMVVVQESLNRAQGSGAQMPQPQGFQKGGLAGAAEALRQRGRGGDTILAHINPQEARMLKSMGGAGTINPATGIMEFKGGGGGIGSAGPIILIRICFHFFNVLSIKFYKIFPRKIINSELTNIISHAN